MNAKRETGLVEEALTHSVIRAFYDVHRELRSGFREYTTKERIAATNDYEFTIHDTSR
jgi:hypothetical protein